MKAKLTNDSTREQGWGRLELTFDDSDQKRPAEGESFTLAVQRLPEQSFLQAPGGDRWPRGGAEYYLTPNGQHWDGQRLFLELGPDFTSALAQVPCFFIVKGSQGTALERIRVDTRILKAPPDDYKIVIDPDAEKRRKEEEERAREAEARAKEAEARAAAEAEAARLKAQEAPPEPVSAPPEPPEKAASSNKKVVFLIVGLLLALLAAGVLAWYFLMYKAAAPEESPPANEPAAEAEPAAQAPPADPKAEVAELFRRNAPYADLEAAFNRLDAQAGAEDAVFLLLTELAKAKPAFRTRLGAFFDPSDPRPAGTIAKDPLAANTEYQAAQEAGDPEAAAQQARLLQWAEENAASDPAAAELLNR